MKPLVLFHAGCADGWCSAWIANRHFAGECECVPVQYGQEPPDVTGREVFILDFSYKLPVLLEMDRKAKKITVLDHHRTAAADLAAGYDLNHEVVSRQGHDGNLLIIFDMTKSGARLTWEFFFHGKPVPYLVRLVEDRDLWKWALPNSREFSAAFASYPWTFDVWDSFAEGITEPHVEPDYMIGDQLIKGRPCYGKYEESLIEQGAAILRYQTQQVESQCKNAHEILMDGQRVLSLNATMLISEIAGKLAEGRPFGVTWFERNDGKRVYSLRSAPDGVDVSEIAKRRGGGGHAHAAGFTE